MFGSMGQTNVKNLGNGGTMDGDVTITGDLTVSGGISLSLNEVLQGTSTIDINSTEALLVRKDGDGGDVFIVDTTNSKVRTNGKLGINMTPDSSTGGMLDIQATDHLKLRFFNSTDFKAGFEVATSNDDMITGAVANDFAIRSQSNILFSAGGSTEIMRLTSTGLKIDGNVGIGNNPHASRKLEITGTNTTNATSSVYTNAVHTGTTDNAVFSVRSDNASASGTVVNIHNDGSGACLNINSNGSGPALLTDAGVGIGISSFWAGETTDHAEISATKAGDYTGLILRNENTDAGDSVSLNFGLARDGGLNFGNAGKILVGKEADFTTTPSTVDSFMAFHTILNETSSEKMRLTSSGSLGIGISPVASQKLHVNVASNVNFTTSANSSSLRLNAVNDVVDATIPLEINSTNTQFLSNVGIGASPSTILNIQSAQPILKLEDTTAYNSSPRNRIEFRNIFNADTVQHPAGYIDMFSSNSTAGNYETHMVFTTRTASSGLIEAMRIDSSQNVGIGEVSSIPSRLSVANTGTDIAVVKARSTTSNARASYQIGNDADNWYMGIDGGNSDSFFIADVVDSSDRLVITQSGAVGIGTDSPTGAGLHINGSGNPGRLKIQQTSASDYSLVSYVTPSRQWNVGVGGASGASELQDNFFFQDVTGSVTLLILDANSRISLSNNDSGGTGGRDSTSGNTIFGYSAGNVNSGAVNNTFIGHASGSGSIDGGDNNTAIGAETLQGLTTASRNQAIGSYSGFSITTGDDNVLIGNDTGFAMTGTSDTVLIGHQAGTAINNTGADGTVAVGYQSLKALTSGQKCTAVGFESLKTNVDGDDNTAIGYQALKTFEATSDGNGQNTAVGSRSLTNLTSGQKNTTLGYFALAQATDTNNCVAVGRYAMGAGDVAGDGQVAVGMEALAEVVAGTNNVGVGYQAGNVIVGGDNCTIIGHGADASGADGQNQIVIGSSATGQADNSVTLGNSSVTDVYMAQDKGAKIHALSAEFNAGHTAGASVKFIADASSSNVTIDSSDTNSATFLMHNSAGTETIRMNSHGGSITCDGFTCSSVLSTPGILFPDSQSASADANMLDDYEEGTWTPAFPANTLTGTLQGTYTKIGDLVTVFFNGQSLDYDGSGNSNIIITGLPFTTASSGMGVVFTSSVAYWAVNITGTGVIQGYVASNTSQIELFETQDNSAMTAVKEDQFSTSSGSAMRFTLQYKV